MSSRTEPGKHALISVICRTVNRASLHEAVASVMQQSWPNIELILVDALGSGEVQIAAESPAVSVRIVNTGHKLERASAANAGLQAASGEYLMFLDDDDWIANDHLVQLHSLISRHPDTLVVYSATQKTRSDGEPFDDPIAVPFDRTVLRRDNFIPIHAALFSRRLLELGCRFDESLAVYEDWDFWLQCATHSDFMLHNYVGAFYRMGGDSQTMLEQHQQRYESGHPMADARARVLDKWRHVWTGQQWNELLGVIDQTPALNDLHAQLRISHGVIDDRDKALQTLEQQYRSLQDDYQFLQSAHIALNLSHEELDRGVKQILNSFSWRVTAPYRWTALRARQWLSRFSHRRHAQTATANPQAVNQHSGPLQAGFLLPNLQRQLFTGAFTLQAWAWTSGTAARVDILLDDSVVYTLDPLPSHKELSEAQRIGFARLIDTTALGAGSHQLTLRVEDNDGHQLLLSQAFVYQEPQQHYLQWLKRHNEEIARQVVAGSKVSLTFKVFLFADHVDTDAQTRLQRSLLSVEQQSYTHHQLQVLTSRECQPDFDHSDIVVFMQAGEVLHKDCLARVAQHWHQHCRVVYSDHDVIDERQRRHAPAFNFAWSPDLLLSQNYIGGVYFLDSSIAGTALQGITSQAIAWSDPAWRYQLLLEVTHGSSAQQITRVQEVLWSEPAPDQTKADARPQAEDNAVRRYLATHHIAAEVNESTADQCRQVRHTLTKLPLVSIIIPTTGKMQFLQPCLDTLKNSSYPNIEIIVLDNGRGQYRDGIAYAAASGAQVIECNEAFNWSRLNNIGARHSRGELLLFLNDDIEITQTDWLQGLVEHALRDDVGTVGCLLLYPNGAIQHAGVFLVDHGGGARHLFHKQLPGRGIYQQLDQCVREVSASTGACLMTRRDRFEQLNGFDEKLSVVGNDIDFCLRANKLGLKNIWTPHSCLVHHESVSRQSKAIGPDEKTMWTRWGLLFRAGDPCYNKNLSLTREDCALADVITPRIAAAPAERVTRDADADTGVNLIAYIRASMGVGEAARGNAAALDACGLPFGIINYERGNPSRMDNLRWQHKEVSAPQYNINLLHINADHMPAVMKDLGRNWFNTRYNIGFWAWEMPEFPDRWLDSFDLVDEVWVPSTYVNQAVACKSPVPVITIPHVINVDMAGARQYPRSSFGIDAQAFVFVSLFDTHSIAQRKNPFGSILAFQKAFAANDTHVQLVIKINNADSANIKVVRDCIGAWQNILLLDQHMDRAYIDSLINCSDCFVSLHHAEGFGLGPAEAMAMGKVALLTGWSGNTEYMRNNNCVAVQYTLKQLGKDYGPYEANQHWAVPDINHAAAEMKDLVANPERARRLGEQAKLDIARDFSAQAIGERMRLRLSHIERIMRKQRR